MLAGHYAAAFAAKAVEPRLRFWPLMLAVQAVDILFALLVLLGAERLHLDFSLPSNPLALDWLPYSHSLLGNLACAFLTYGGCRIWRMARRPALLLAAAVLSHWFLDVAIHRHDMVLYPGGAGLGTDLWNHPALANGFELGLLGLGVLFFLSRNTRAGLHRTALELAGILTAVQLYAVFAPPPPTVPAMMLSLLATWLALAGLAAWRERQAGRRDPVM